ncbi:MAG: hypothetical protein KC731_12455 [Myxococcales bacterium]|nr:hypothetical protein [Myxococcales bacterium]
MQHARLIGGIKRVTAALEESGLREALGGSEPTDPERLLEALRRYSIAAARYDLGESTVADLLGLSELENSSVWARLLSDDAARRHFHERVGFVTHHLPRFVELLEETTTVPSPEATLCVSIVGEETQRGVAVSRVVTVINCLERLYEVGMDAHGLVSGELRLVSLDDAGADTLLWFEGDAAALQPLKETLTVAFRWLALYDEGELEERLQVAAQQLPLVARIHGLARTDTFDDDEADLLEHEVLMGLLAFFDAGALIPEMAQDLRRDPRAIVTPPPPPVAIGEDPLSKLAREIEQLADRESSAPPPSAPPSSDPVIELAPESVELLDDDLADELWPEDEDWDDETAPVR